LIVKFSAALYDKLLDTGWNGLFVNSPVLEIYSGAQMDSPELAVPVTYDHYLTISLSSPPWQNASGGVKLKDGQWLGTFAVGGTPEWFRLRNDGDADGEDYTVSRIDGTIGVDQDKDILIAKAVWYAGETLFVDNFSIVAAFAASMGVTARGILY
jgi:hypothetical protein